MTQGTDPGPVPKGGSPRTSALVRSIDAAKRHPVVVVAVTLVAVATFATTTWGIVRGTADVIDRRLRPHEDLYAQIEQLRLDVTPEHVDGILGPPDSVVDPRADCGGCRGLSLRIYRLDRDATVRALFDGSTLGMFLVTGVDPDVEPQIRWQETARGALGDTSFAEASALTDDGTVTPTDVAFWPGAQRITYTEVFALGAPGNYEGLMLAHTTEGASTTPWDSDDAQAVADSFEEPAADLPADGVEFRRVSGPNTFGTFRDDGRVGELVREADFVTSMLVAGTYG